VILTLVSDVASDYFLLRDLDLQLQITEDTIRTQEASVKLTEARLRHGVGTTLDVLQARQVLDTANAQIPDLERQIGQTEDAINILLGKYPDNVPRGMPLGMETPDGLAWSETLSSELPAGLPSALLERRRMSSLRGAVLVVRLTTPVVVLHGLKILLWASFYHWRCLQSWTRQFTSQQAVIRL
jgi:multidrug efflux system outer membrane protein